MPIGKLTSGEAKFIKLLSSTEFTPEAEIKSRYRVYYLYKLRRRGLVEYRALPKTKRQKYARREWRRLTAAEFVEKINQYFDKIAKE